MRCQRGTKLPPLITEEFIVFGEIFATFHPFSFCRIWSDFGGQKKTWLNLFQALGFDTQKKTVKSYMADFVKGEESVHHFPQWI